MPKCKQCFVMSDGSIKLCYECLEAKVEKLEADLKISQSVCETIEKEVTAINDRLREQSKELEAENDKFKDALVRIDNWAKAYPLNVFPKPDLKHKLQRY